MTVLTDRVKAASISRPSPDLAHLIHPVDLATFEREHWEKSPLYVHREDPDHFAGLLSLADVDRVLSLSAVRGGDLRVVQDGNEIAISDLVPRGATSGTQLDALFERYRTGHTLVLNALENRWEPLRRLARTLGAEISARVQVNVYVTPAGNRGFKPHYDTHDVFVAQVHGTKHWQLFGAPIDLPLETQPHDKTKPLPTVPEREIDMRRGDLLYLPRGTMHAATANDTASVHLTIGVHPIRWSQMLEAGLRSIVRDDVRFRRGLPIGFARDGEPHERVEQELAQLIQLLAQRLTPSALAADAAARATTAAYPVLDDHLLDLEDLASIDIDTVVRRRAQLQYRFTVEGETAKLEFHGKTVEFPARVAGEVRYVAESGGDRFTGEDIPGNLDDPGRVVLVGTLVREGFLTLCRD